MFKEWYEQHKEENLKDFFTLLNFPSISTNPLYENELRSCADWLHHFLVDMGLLVEIWAEESKAPTLFAHDMRAGSDKETLLIYCHYDVQPIDPLEEWISPPFDPEIREGEIYARGTSDNKGQLFYTLLAIKSYLKLKGKFDFNLKIIIEGQEESGSFILNTMIHEKKKELQADHFLIVDTGFSELSQPAISLGCRGIICLEVTLQEAAFDLHSGHHGGMAYNPNRALAELLSSFYKEGRIAIEGFYNNCVTLDDPIQKEMCFDFDKEKFKHEFGYLPLKKNPLWATWFEPTLEINGIAGGYAEEGFKTVIPSEAHAKISCRVAPRQDPHVLLNLIHEHIKKHVPSNMILTIKDFSKSPAILSHPNEKIVQIMKKAYADVFGQPINIIMMGGSIPIAHAIAEASGAKVVFVGVGLANDHIHAPNEHFGVERLKLGFLTIVKAFDLL